MTKKMTTDIKNYGLKLSESDITPDQYTLGGGQLSSITLQPDRNWKPFLPKTELQYNTNLDTNACYIYGSLNTLEILLNRLYGSDHNYAERFIAFYVNHNFVGGNPHDALEKIRNEGNIPEELLPFTSEITKQDYLLPKMKVGLEVEGQKFLQKYTVKHDWLFLPRDTNKAEILWQALQYSPIGVSVLAWQKDGEYYSKPVGATDSHWCVVVGGEYEKYWEVFDTYDETIKKLAWDYDFNFSKRILVSKTILKRNWLLDLLNRLYIWRK